MNKIKTFCISVSLLSTALMAFVERNGHAAEVQAAVTDTLPDVFAKNHADLVESRLRNEAVLQFGMHQLPTNRKDWEVTRKSLRQKIIQKAGVVENHQLPLNMRETGSVKMNGYQIKKISFQTRPGVYATANLYVPDGKGPFPAVVTMHGHWPGARLYESFQAISQTAALNGYVCLNIDAYGSGERTTVHGKDEYHGANLGASLMNVGETLLGVQVSDNMRGVDLLSSLPYVNAAKIGATGASGGGNQTMWLAALDERIKAAMLVVSVGTFESYIMRSNCICELLPDGFTLTEEAGILAMIAPRALKICNNVVDNPTFISTEMLRSYHNARPVFKMLGVENNISSVVSNMTHGYWPENRQAMLGWFDLHLKGVGTGAPKKEIAFETLPNEQLMVYPAGARDAGVQGIAAYCKRKGTEFRSAFKGLTTVNADQKRNQLRDILRINEPSKFKKLHSFAAVDGWDRMALETTDDKLIPILHKSPIDPSKGYVIITNAAGKKSIAASLINQYINNGVGIAVVDLSGTGEAASKENVRDKTMVLHTLSRAELWLGKTMLGEWAKELGVVADFLKTNFKARKIGVEGAKEAGLAALFLGATESKADFYILRDVPVSYLFDNRESVDYFSMATHLPKFLQWGDVSLASALTARNVTIIDPVTMSGQKLDNTKLGEFQREFNSVRKLSGQPGSTILNTGSKEPI